jgi:hypothetical protein
MTVDEVNACADELEARLTDDDAANAEMHFRDVSRADAQKVIDECLRRNLARINQTVSTLQSSVLAPGLDLTRFQGRDYELRTLWRALS